MSFRCLVAVTLYTLLIGPVMDFPSNNARAKSKGAAVRSMNR
jgi:hypothetical protein